MKKIICITCPTGCEIEVTEEGGKIGCSGNRCPRGAAYAESELRDPRRTVTAVIRTVSGGFQPVRTDRPLPKAFINGLLNTLLRGTYPEAEPGAVIMADVGGTGVNLIASGPAR